VVWWDAANATGVTHVEAQQAKAGRARALAAPLRRDEGAVQGRSRAAIAQQQVQGMNAMRDDRGSNRVTTQNRGQCGASCSCNAVVQQDSGVGRSLGAVANGWLTVGDEVEWQGAVTIVAGKQRQPGHRARGLASRWLVACCDRPRPSQGGLSQHGLAVQRAGRGQARGTG
jgi:hypothetical protein